MHREVFLCYLQYFFISSNFECLFQAAKKHGCTGKDWGEVQGWLFLHLQDGLVQGEQASCLQNHRPYRKAQLKDCLQCVHKHIYKHRQYTSGVCVGGGYLHLRSHYESTGQTVHRAKLSAFQVKNSKISTISHSSTQIKKTKITDSIHIFNIKVYK